MKITKNGIVKFIDDSRLDYYELQGWSGQKAKSKPVKHTVTTTPAVDEETESSSEEAVTTLKYKDNKGD